MITRLYELLTGQPWTTTRTMATEYGPPPAVQYARQLAGYSDLELIRNGPQILAQLREEAAVAADLDNYHREDLREALLDCGCPAGRIAIGHGHELHCHRNPNASTVREQVSVP